MNSKNNSSKRIKPSEDGIDRISNLPEPIISHILSLLPTENAVATSLLSTRWKLLWTSITSLYFDEQTICSRPKKGLNMKRAKFTLFVNRVFMFISRPCIQNFRLDCTHLLFDPLNLILWISLIASTVCKFELNLDLQKGNPKVFELQINHFHFSKLVKLKLKGRIEIKIPAQAFVNFPNLLTLYLCGIRFSDDSSSSFSFPNLKFLHLDSVEYKNEDSVHKLFSSCPVLYSLFIHFKRWKHLPSLIICVPSLRRLTIGFWCRYEDRVFEIQIDKLHKLNFLSVSGYALKAITTSSTNISSDFRYLMRLDLEVRDCSECCAVIKDLLGSMDNLKHLRLKRGHRCSCSEKSWWIEPLNVPKCLRSRVTSISFKLTKDDCHDELELVRYFLTKAKVLQVFKLNTESCSSERKLQLTEKISMFPKGSQTCQGRLPHSWFTLLWMYKL